MISELVLAGFSGVEMQDAVIYARSNPALPEFRVLADGAAWRMEIAWPLRASDAQRAQWNGEFPDAVLDIFQGETRMVMRLAGQQTAGSLDLDLRRWAMLCDAMVQRCTQWRRAARQRDEGM